VIDLHLHTLASDGRSTPSELVDLAAAAGLTAMAVTDHDTTASVADVRQFAEARGIEAVSGIEITAVLNSRDVHMLGYFFDPRHPTLMAFLVEQRKERIDRVEAIVERLAELKMPLNFKAQIEVARRPTGVSLARPHVARAMVAAGYAKTVQAAFDLWLAEGQPAFIERVGPSPADVAAIVHAAGGLLSMAHPGRTRIDEEIPGMVDAGLDALEVFHSDHDAELVARYQAMAAELGLLMTGGTDFHADPASPLRVGTVTLPLPEWERLSAARHRHRQRLQ
jgi:3',5'-nucleoside bisphosphate phosphatase